MSLLWPGAERAGDLFSESAFLSAMVRVEEAWLAALVSSGIAPSEAGTQLGGLVSEADVAALASGAEGGGNPVIVLVKLLRDRLNDRPDAARWLHKGLTSQDVVDTALVLCLADVLDRVEDELGAQASSLVGLAREHRSTVMPGRTLTQHAVPITFGLKAATWLSGVVDAAEALRRARAALPAQVGGAAGTLAAIVELARLRGLNDPVAVAQAAASAVATALGLASRSPWHTSRSPLVAAADALVGAADGWGSLASDVAALTRPEIGELAEPAGEGRGGSSTMPHKSNPVLSVLIRRHALAAPLLAATLHTAAASYVDERPDGAWHVEWETLQILARRSVVAASQVTELLAGLRVDGARMRATAEAAGAGLLAEQRSLAEFVSGLGGGVLTDAVSGLDGYLGAADALIDTAIARARETRKRLD
ncbi:3-carboxy-cis,cis-muconate cycloisomerase [Nocardioides luteus]|uniref:3-carboxy-cis,cis-muconate cycloisomerase n=1 Tax=Nocardioides luteus TaxID=1844 RepID=A0ABQ5T452_9ACTN|nr:lyase family protein [Nocardioides luteus]MDR7311610.1 3-carboxy-cis,cis-muconate cycloisomerase [Nocardioides luteus]GGR54425.1 3-carboxy-cis,cis-muconate cycloisomerase [Nocardioides luteus]GLJ70259.1 3-carboxy-cis,cis-muconate cycloisomerase [Nocardioides luteus]